MIKKLLLSAVLLSALSFRTNDPDPNKKYTVTISLPVNEWNAVIRSIGSSDQLSAKSAAGINEMIVIQINSQMAKDTIKPVKKIP